MQPTAPPSLSPSLVIGKLLTSNPPHLRCYRWTGQQLRAPAVQHGRVEMSYIGTKCYETERGAEERNKLHTAHTVFGLWKDGSCGLMEKGNEIWIKKPGLGFLYAGVLQWQQGQNVASSLRILGVSASFMRLVIPIFEFGESRAKATLFAGVCFSLNCVLTHTHCHFRRSISKYAFKRLGNQLERHIET